MRKILVCSVKIVSDAEKRVSRKKAMIVKKIRSLKKSLKDEDKKRAVFKKKGKRRRKRKVR